MNRDLSRYLNMNEIFTGLYLPLKIFMQAISEKEDKNLFWKSSSMEMGALKHFIIQEY